MRVADFALLEVVAPSDPRHLAGGRVLQRLLDSHRCPLTLDWHTVRIILILVDHCAGNVALLLLNVLLLQVWAGVLL